MITLIDVWHDMNRQIFVQILFFIKPEAVIATWIIRGSLCDMKTAGLLLGANCNPSSNPKFTLTLNININSPRPWKLTNPDRNLTGKIRQYPAIYNNYLLQKLNNLSMLSYSLRWQLGRKMYIIIIRIMTCVSDAWRLPGQCARHTLTIGNLTITEMVRL